MDMAITDSKINTIQIQDKVKSNYNLVQLGITGMYTPRMLDSQAVGHGIVLPSGANATAPVVASAIDTASDSAISSMGSERGPSIAEGDWIDNSASDSNATSSGATAVSSGSAYGMEYSSGYWQLISQGLRSL